MNSLQAGQQLRRVRERLGLRFRDVEQASLQIAAENNNFEFAIGLSRLADIESKGTLPSIYRLYSLCAIYKLGFASALRWYGIDLERLPGDSFKTRLKRTTPIDVDTNDPRAVKIVDQTGNKINEESNGPSSVLSLFGMISPEMKIIMVGNEDRSLEPLIPAGSIVIADQGRRKIETRGGRNRPLYLVGTRDSYRIGWCSVQGGQLLLQTHWESGEGPFIFQYPGEVDVIGQIVAITVRMDQDLTHRGHSSTALKLPQSR